MKVKQRPEDFQVEEVTDLVAGRDGPFAFYRLEKSGWSTPDALAAVRRRWQIDLQRLSYGGLKDRHANTIQYLTIHNGPRRGLRHHTVTLHYLGQVLSPYTSADIVCNRFRITLRDLPKAQRETIATRIARVAQQGVPNYFDDQRFGSVTGLGGEFIARLLVKGQFEEGLKLALTAPYAHDRAPQKAEKQTLLRHWGDWERCKQLLPRGHARSLVDYLRLHPGDFKGAVARLRPDLRGLYLSAYQSHLWNRLLARWLTDHLPVERLELIQLRLGPVPFPRQLEEAEQTALETLNLPLPTSRWKPAADDPRLPLVEAVLAEDSLTLRDMQIRGLRTLFFSRGERAALCPVQGLQEHFSDDDRHPGRLALTLAFELPRGSSATLVVKAVTGQVDPS